jgi:tetratricopeptide (TPR) repeat protein
LAKTISGRWSNSFTEKCRNPLWISPFLAVITLAAYWPVTHYGFVDYDDSDYVTQNPYVQAGLSARSLAWVWHSEVARNWHPLTMLSHMMDCQIYRMRPAGHHLTNLLFHVANTLLLLFLLSRLTGALWRSTLVAALFALHPLHVESVAWVAERKDVLSTFFFLLTLASYGRYVAGRRVGAKAEDRKPKTERNPKSERRVAAVARDAKAEDKVGGGRTPAVASRPKVALWYGLALFLFACGLMSKPMLVTTPFVLLLLDFWPLGRLKGSTRFPLLIEKLPFFLLAVASCIVTYLVQEKGGAVLGVSHFPIANRLGNALMSYGRYLEKMVWPQGLAPLYLKHGAWAWWQAGLAAALLLAVSIIALWQVGCRPYLPFGWFWYLGTLVPVIGLVQVGMQSMADRYTYIPLIGIFIIVAWGGGEVAARWRVPRSVLLAVTSVVLAGCMILTHQQLAYWKDGETLLRRMIWATESNYMAHYNLGNVYSRTGRLPEAVREYEAALAAQPNYAEAHNNLGTVLLRQGRFDEAIAHHTAAVRLRPELLYYFNLANAFADAGKFSEAVANYQAALKLDPASSQAHHNLGLVLQSQGQSASAMAEFRAALQLQPDYESAAFNLANRLADAGQLEEAIAYYRAAERLDPNHAETYNGLGICYAMQGKFEEAERQFREAVRLKPNHSGAQSNLGNALGAQNKLDKAIPHYQTALQIDPTDYQTHFNLGVSLFRQGRRAEAKDHFTEALRLHPDYPEARKALAELSAAP